MLSLQTSNMNTCTTTVKKMRFKISKGRRHTLQLWLGMWFTKHVHLVGHDRLGGMETFYNTRHVHEVTLFRDTCN